MATRYTYLGVLDDFAERHGDTAIRTLDELNDQLVLAALFSDPLLINDGYLLSHPVIHQALLKPDSSPLKSLIECGFIKILSRNDGQLGSLADVMASAGISAVQNLLADSAYLKHYKPLLQKWGDELNSSAFDSLRSWPNIRVDDVFRSVSKETLKAIKADTQVVSAEVSLFDERLSDTVGRRTEWENIALKLRDDGKLSPQTLQKLMFAANETYQYAWGCALLTQSPLVRVLTRLPWYLTQLEAAEFEIAGSAKKPVEVMVPNAAFAQNAIAKRWALLANMVTPGHELNRLKHAFLDRLRAYYASDTLDRRQAQNASKEFTTALSKHFGKQTAVSVTFDLVFVGASTAAGGAVAGPPGMALGALVGVAGAVANLYGAPRLLWRLAAPSPKKWLVHRKLSAEPNVMSCFQLSGEQARLHTRDAKSFR